MINWHWLVRNSWGVGPVARALVLRFVTEPPAAFPTPGSPTVHPA